MECPLSKEQIEQILKGYNDNSGVEVYAKQYEEFLKKEEEETLTQEDVILDALHRILFWLYQFLTLPTEENITLDYQKFISNIFDNDPFLILEANNFKITITKPRTLADISTLKRHIQLLNIKNCDDFELLFNAFGDLMKVELKIGVALEEVKDLKDLTIEEGRLLYHTSTLIYFVMLLYLATFNYVGKKKKL